MKKIMVVVFMMVLPVVCVADNEAKRESIEQLLVVMNVDAMIDSMYTQMDRMFQGMAKELGVKESEREIFDKFMSKTAAAMKEEMTWVKMKEPMIDVYIKNYSEEEINDMLAFYESESGRSIIKKMPAVMADSMLISQNMLKDFMPRLKELSAELENDLKQARNKGQ